MNQALTQVAWIGRRSIIRTLRQPAAIVPAIIFPLFFLVFMSAGLSSVASIPGFPAPTYLSFALAGAMVQGAMFSGMNCAADLALDIQTGFINRISLTPIQGTTLILGQMFGGLGVALLQVATYLAYGAISGVDFQTGPGGLLVVVLVSLVIATAFGSAAALVAARTGSAEAVQAMFPLFFVFMTFSSFFMPRALISTGWFRTIADYNPVTYFIESIRGLIVSGWSIRELALGLGLAIVVAVAGVTGASKVLKTRLARS